MKVLRFPVLVLLALCLVPRLGAAQEWDATSADAGVELIRSSLLVMSEPEPSPLSASERLEAAARSRGGRAVLGAVIGGVAGYFAVIVIGGRSDEGTEEILAIFPGAVVGAILGAAFALSSAPE